MNLGRQLTWEIKHEIRNHGRQTVWKRTRKKKVRDVVNTVVDGPGFYINEFVKRQAIDDLWEESLQK